MRLLFLSGLLVAASMTAACDNFNRLSEVGRAPAVEPVSNPTADPNWRTVSMPMPPVASEPNDTASLFRGSRTFLRDQRAAHVGDLVTVLVQIQDRAQLANTTSRSRDNSETLGVPNLFGLENSVRRIAPTVIDPSSLVDLSSTNSSVGSGAIQRREQVTLRVATTVVQTLPNGNLVVTGRQQVRVNSELRDLAVSGVIRPQDITRENTIAHDRLAEARITYGGRGTLSDVQTPRYGQQILDIILPF
ncbi:MAG: flagellar basal body L-ring protein FlgH [Roseomonas sp.]|nr:flagellar basal body L-ring protein FlgH [Roseomonas sp.]